MVVLGCLVAFACGDDSTAGVDGGGDGASCSDCDDGLFCNGFEACLDGTCQAGAAPCPVDCDEDTDRCVDCDVTPTRTLTAGTAQK